MSRHGRRCRSTTTTTTTTATSQSVKSYESSVGDGVYLYAHDLVGKLRDDDDRADVQEDDDGDDDGDDDDGEKNCEYE